MFARIVRLAFPPMPGNRASAGLLLVRILFGIGIFLHGYAKIGNITGFSNAIGVPVPLGALAVLTETVGGLLLVVGALTPLIALMLTGNMIVATLMTMSKHGFLVSPSRENPGFYTQGWEFAALYLVAFACLLLAGPGRFAIDAAIFRKHLK